MKQGIDWNSQLYLAIQAARMGREVLLDYLGKLKMVEEKESAGLVSEADREAEKIIFSHLRRHFPNDTFLGEETSFLNKAEILRLSTTKGRWIVDPLDGTTNFVHQFPVFCVSIGYEWEGSLQLAVIDVPIFGEVYTAIKGHGAFCNGKKLQVSQTSSLEKSLLATGFFPDIERNLEEQIKIFSRIVRKVRGVRRAGAAAYDLCMVARGVFDGYWEKNLQPWDSAAGALLVREAGGLVETYRGKNYDPFCNSLVAGNSTIVSSLRREMSSIINQDSD
jgi:myo-inositol-1(or 4)-monophosphatase